MDFKEENERWPQQMDTEASKTQETTSNETKTNENETEIATPEFHLFPKLVPELKASKLYSM